MFDLRVREPLSLHLAKETSTNGKKSSIDVWEISTEEDVRKLISDLSDYLDRRIAYDCFEDIIEQVFAENSMEELKREGIDEKEILFNIYYLHGENEIPLWCLAKHKELNHLSEEIIERYYRLMDEKMETSENLSYFDDPFDDDIPFAN